MTELQLLEQWNELERKIEILLEKISMGYSEEEKETFSLELAQLKEQENIIKDSLSNLENKDSSLKAKKAIRQQISSYITEINKSVKGLKLVRNQGLAFDNYLIASIIGDISHLVEGEFWGIRVPQHLLYSFNDPTGIEISDLSIFLNAEIQTLNNLEKTDYLTLKDFVAGFSSRICNKFISKQS